MLRSSSASGRSSRELPALPADRDTQVRRALGRRLARVRGERGLTQKAVAEALGTSQEGVSRYERGRYAPSLAVLLALRRLFAVSLDSLVAGTPPGEIADPRLRQLALAADALSHDRRTLIVKTLRGLLEGSEAEAQRARRTEGAE